VKALSDTLYYEWMLLQWQHQSLSSHTHMRMRRALKGLRLRFLGMQAFPFRLSESLAEQTVGPLKAKQRGQRHSHTHRIMLGIYIYLFFSLSPRLYHFNILGKCISFPGCHKKRHDDDDDVDE